MQVPYAVASFNFFTEDIATLLGPDATMNERMQAAAFTFIKPAKIADTGHDLVKAGEKAKDVGNGVNKTNLRNIDNFINGNKKFDEVIEDYARVYKHHADLNKPWSWDDTIPCGDMLKNER